MSGNLTKITKELLILINLKLTSMASYWTVPTYLFIKLKVTKLSFSVTSIVKELNPTVRLWANLGIEWVPKFS